MNPLDKYTRKQIIINRYHARQTNNYKQYILAGGSGSKSDYRLFCKINRIKTENREALLNDL